MALVVGGANEVANSIEEDANKPGGTDNPLAITEGKPFEVDGFNYAAGWSIGKNALGDVDVKGLKVANNRDSSDSALVEIKLWKGTEVLALSNCATQPIDVRHHGHAVLLQRRQDAARLRQDPIAATL